MPYNPHLLRAFDCHINVEACSSIKSVKYLFKYVYKGHDRASIAVRESGQADKEGNIDEIKAYRDARGLGKGGTRRRAEVLGKDGGHGGASHAAEEQGGGQICAGLGSSP